MSDLLTRVSIDGAAKLALRFPAGALQGAGATLRAAMGEEGWLLRGEDTPGEDTPGGPAMPWRFESIVREGDSALLVGPNVFGPEAPGAEAVSTLDDPAGLDAGMPRLLTLARALYMLKAQGALPRGIVSSGILFAEDGGVLVLPPTAVAKALSARGEQARAAAVARLTHPRSGSAEADASFLLAQAAYRFAAGKGAHEREAAEPRGVAGTAPVAIATGLAAPRLDPRLAEIVDRALDDPGSLPLGDWVAALDAASAAGWTRALPPAEEADLVRRRSALEARANARRRRADFLRKRGGIIVASAVVLAVAGLVAADMIRAYRDKPDLSMLSPRELAQKYYQAIDGIDMDTLEACGDGKATKRDQDYMVNLVVVTKTRTAYEGKSPVVRAADWLAAGGPAGGRVLAPSDLLYGITGLEISGGEDWSGATSVSIAAKYSFWTLDRKDDPSGDPAKTVSSPYEERRIDRLTLGRGKKGGWSIVGLARETLP